MTNQKVIIEILKQYSCLTSEELKFFAKRLFKQEISTGSAAGIMRTLINQGKACKQMHPTKHKTIYWLTEEAKNEIL